MNRKKATELWPIIKAFSEGRAIQVKDNNVWKDVDDNHNCVFLPEEYEYRIKPEPKYYPFANAEECWQEMQKHQPIGWVKRNGYYYNIVSTDITSVRIINNKGAIIIVSFSNLLSSYTFVDGTQFGIKVEE